MMHPHRWSNKSLVKTFAHIAKNKKEKCDQEKYGTMHLNLRLCILFAVFNCTHTGATINIGIRISSFTYRNAMPQKHV